MPTIHNINFTVYIDNGGNAAFGESVPEILEEVRIIVGRAMDRLDRSVDASGGHFTKPLRDSNGNKVGKLSIDIEFEPEEEEVEEE